MIFSSSPNVLSTSTRLQEDRKLIYDVTAEYIAGSYDSRAVEEKILGLHERLNMKLQGSAEFQRVTGLAFLSNPERVGVRLSTRYPNVPSFQIQNLRLVSRVGPQGSQVNHVVFSLIQRSGIFFNKDGTVRREKNGRVSHFSPPGQGLNYPCSNTYEIPEGGFEFRGGCTLIFDLDKLELKYVITKPLLEQDADPDDPCVSVSRAECQYKFRTGINELGFNEYSAYFTDGLPSMLEPFCFLHQH